MGKILDLRCQHCGGIFQDLRLFVCPVCGFPISATYEYDIISETVTRDAFGKDGGSGIWRYATLLPEISHQHQVSLGEGQTPLTACRRLGRDFGMSRLYAKLDCLNPTGSFKDRGSAVGASFALENGFMSIGCTSSGNMAASVSAYGARANLEVIIFVPSLAPKEKLIQASMYGSKIVGTGEMPAGERYDLSHRVGRERRVLMINSNSPLRLEGQKTFAFEVWEDLGRKAPDWIVIPTSSGGNTYAIVKGFNELRAIGLIDQVPRVLVAQSTGCAPIVNAFKRGKKNVDRWSHPQSIASAILNPNPPSGERVLAALAEFGGSAEMVSDQEITQAVKDLAAKEGIFSEPSSATSLAALRKAVSAGTIGTDQSVVLDITGVGFKDLRVATELYRGPEPLEEWLKTTS